MGSIYGDPFAFEEAKDAVNHVINYSVLRPSGSGSIFIFQPSLEEKIADANAYSKVLDRDGFVRIGNIEISKTELR
jgi:hypothetical protein